MNAGFNDPRGMLAYTLAGRAVLTLQSQRTGNHYTFRVGASRDGEVFFVSVRTGDDFAYLGMIRGKDFGLTRASKFDNSSTATKVFRFFWNHLAAGTMPPQTVVRHEGHCGRCGRELTHPESIDLGIGPECRRMLRAA